MEPYAVCVRDKGRVIVSRKENIVIISPAAEIEKRHAELRCKTMIATFPPVAYFCGTLINIGVLIAPWLRGVLITRGHSRGKFIET